MKYILKIEVSLKPGHSNPEVHTATKLLNELGYKVDLVDEGELSSNPDLLTSDSNVESMAKENRFIGYYKTSALTGDGVTDAFKALVKKLYMIAKISSFS